RFDQHLAAVDVRMHVDRDRLVWSRYQAGELQIEAVEKSNVISRGRTVRSFRLRNRRAAIQHAGKFSEGLRFQPGFELAGNLSQSGVQFRRGLEPCGLSQIRWFESLADSRITLLHVE